MAETNYDIPTVRKAVALIKCLCEADGPMGVTEISRAVDTNKNMVFRLLHTLREEGWVVQKDGGLYAVSLQPYHYASKPVSRMDFRAAGIGPLERLWKVTGESCYLAVLDDDRVLFIEHLDGVREVRTAARPGGRYYLHCSAPGKVLLAHAGAALLGRLVEEGLDRNTESTICDPGVLAAEAARVREAGYAIDDEEYGRGMMCFAAPVYNYEDRVVGTIGASVLRLFYDSRDEMITRLGPVVMRAAEEISLQLGMDQARADRYRGRIAGVHEECR